MEIETVALILMTVMGLAIAAGLVWILLRGKKEV
jgi:LPXTG-motif cell wall-anchored protein